MTTKTDASQVMALRKAIRSLIRDVPDSELGTVKRFMEFVTEQTKTQERQPLESLPVDDEPMDERTPDAIRRGLGDMKNGRVVSHETLKKEFGIAG